MMKKNNLLRNLTYSSIVSSCCVSLTYAGLVTHSLNYNVNGQGSVVSTITFDSSIAPPSHFSSVDLSGAQPWLVDLTWISTGFANPVDNVSVSIGGGEINGVVLQGFNGSLDATMDLVAQSSDINFFTIADNPEGVAIYRLETLTGIEIILTSTTPLNLASIAHSYRVQSITPKLASTTINGSHHRLLMDSALDKDGWHTWMTGDFSSFDEIDATQAIGEVGASRNFGIENFRLGFGIGYTTVDQDAAFGGGAKIDGEFAVVEANYKLEQANVILSALGYYGQYDVETERGYLLPGQHSTGETDAETFAIRLRADWKNAYTQDKFSVTPRFAYTYSNSSADAYTEVDGISPASFDEQNSENHELRLGVDVDYALNVKTSIRAILECVHLASDNENLRGSVGATSFDLAGEDLENTWGRLGLEGVHKLNETTQLHASAFASTEGYDATYTGSLGLNINF